MFRVFHIKTLLIILALCLTTTLIGISIVKSTSNTKIPQTTYTIVLDAGHGGRDNGCSSQDGIKESDINLSITKTLKNYLSTLGINVVLTRHDSGGLYKSNVDNYKLDDMNARIEIINKSNPNLVISIHQNSYPDSTLRGAQAFYQENDEISREFASCIQSQLLSQLEHTRTSYNHGDYYILNQSKTPAVLIECGYLTNNEDAQLLSSVNYQNKVAYAIMCGVVKYFGLYGNN